MNSVIVKPKVRSTEHDVFRLEIAMEDLGLSVAAGMEIGQSGAHVQRNLKLSVQRQLSALLLIGSGGRPVQHLSQISSLHPFLTRKPSTQRRNETAAYHDEGKFRRLGACCHASHEARVADGHDQGNLALEISELLDRAGSDECFDSDISAAIHTSVHTAEGSDADHGALSKLERIDVDLAIQAFSNFDCARFKLLSLFLLASQLLFHNILLLRCFALDSHLLQCCLLLQGLLLCLPFCVDFCTKLLLGRFLRLLLGQLLGLLLSFLRTAVSARTTQHTNTHLLPLCLGKIAISLCACMVEDFKSDVTSNKAPN